MMLLKQRVLMAYEARSPNLFTVHVCDISSVSKGRLDGHRRGKYSCNANFHAKLRTVSSNMTSLLSMEVCMVRHGVDSVVLFVA